MSINIVQAERLLSELELGIRRKLDGIGLFYRIFTRVKSPDSIDKKLKLKGEKYGNNGKKIQDVLGVRITVYFEDDENIAIGLLQEIFQEVPEDHSIDSPNNQSFGPERCNLIFRIPENLSQRELGLSGEMFDSTFEVQFRTIFSEGWHEIEHDLRYKCKLDWIDEDVLDRQLNSQLATLQSSDWVIFKIFEELAHTKYKKKQWSAFFRSTMRIRFTDEAFSEPILIFFDNNPHIAKKLMRINRKKLIGAIFKLTTQLPLTMDTVLHTLNRAIINNEDLKYLELPYLKRVLDSSFNAEAPESQRSHLSFI